MKLVMAEKPSDVGETNLIFAVQPKGFGEPAADNEQTEHQNNNSFS